MHIVHRNRPRAVAIAEAIDGLLGTSASRRRVLRLLGGTGLASAGFLGHRRLGAFAQDATAPPAATPRIGQQADGSTLWRVKVADMKMDQKPIVEFHGFYPSEMTITAGDAIWFDYGMGGFHTVTFLSGGDVPPLFLPDPEAGTPAAGAPPKLILNPTLVFPAGGDSYDGTGYVNSGIDVFRDPTQPYVLTFTKAGTYDYQCAIHGAVMKAKLVVQEAGSAPAHTQAEVDQMAAAEIAKLADQAATEIATYQDATSTPNADGTTTWEATVGAGGQTQVRVQAFLPLELAVKVGDTVKWVHRAPEEPHTVSFVGAGETPPEDTIVEQFADGSPKFVQSMQTFLPQGGNVWSGTGWLNSGFLGIPQLGLPMEVEYTFDTPGDYIVFCVLHGDAQGARMAAKLKVSPR